MLHLHYADRLDALADALADDIHAARARSNPARMLRPVSIVVPNPVVFEYVVFRFAQRHGVAANLTYQFLGQCFADLARTHAPGVSLAQGEILTAHFIHLLLDETLLEKPSFEVVRGFLGAAGSDDAVVDHRRYQLASRLSSLFETYSIAQPRMLGKWRRSELPLEEDNGPASWQARLYHALVHGAPRCMLLDQLPEAINAERVARDRDDPLFLFGLRSISPTEASVLDALRETRDVYVYALNPCEEFWEDASRRPLREDKDEDDDEEASTSEPVLLTTWGGSARASIRVLNALSNFDFENHFEPRRLPEAPGSRLRELQADVRTRRPHGPANAPCVDDSLHIMACASVRRELEAVAQTIIAKVQQSRSQSTSPPIHLHEVGILVPDHQKEAYYSHAGAVFEAFDELPFNLVAAPVASTSRIIEIVRALLALPSSRFTRSDLLSILVHPSVAARFPGIQPELWTRWCESLGVLHGRSRSDHASTYVTEDIYNWEQGVTRLMLGLFLTSERSGDTRIFDPGGHPYLPLETAPGDFEQVAEFSKLVRGLIRDATFAKVARIPLRDWAALIRSLVIRYVGTASESDERDLLRCLRVIQNLGEPDVGGRPVSFTIAHDFVQRGLEALRTNLGHPLMRGVTVGPLSALAGLPFRLTFVVGLGEGCFPRTSVTDELELEAESKLESDSIPRLQDDDRRALLEAFLGATDHFVMSYVSRDARTGDILEPSPVISEMLDILGAQATSSGDETPPIVERHALRRYEDVPGQSGPSTRPELWATVRERQALELRQALLEHTRRTAARASSLPTFDELISAAPPSAGEALRSRFGLPKPPAASAQLETSPEERRTLPYRALRGFLEDPLEAWAQHVLGIRMQDTEVDPILVSDEVFESPRLTMTTLLRESFLDHLQASSQTGIEDLSRRTLPDTYEARARLYELSGKIPTGIFLEHERAEHLRILEAWRTQTDRILAADASSPPVVLRFGRAREHLRVEHVFAPLLLELQISPVGHSSTTTVALSGATQPFASTTTRLTCFSFVPQPRIDRTTRLRLEVGAFLDYAVLAALGPAAGHRFRSVIVSSGQETSTTDFARLAPDDARAYLEMLAQELLSVHHAYALPLAAIGRLQEALVKGAHHPDQIRRLLNAWVRRRPAPHHFGSEVMPPEPRTAMRMMVQRFSPFFDRREEA
ncbi:MAG: exodeoxyribonuclease V subunit gamma [Deltaproteobacteria bacterium]|nr:exodeoxyribonuclease V subunit gamma [Deltaproteobacteria bacterium]